MADVTNQVYFVGKEELQKVITMMLQEVKESQITVVDTLTGSADTSVPSVKAVKDALADLDGFDHVVVQSVDGKSIKEMVTEPQTNTIYMFKESDEDDNWDMYIYAEVVVDGTSKLTWVTLGKYTPGAAPDMTGYWSKTELVAMPESVIQEAFNAAKASMNA